MFFQFGQGHVLADQGKDGVAVGSGRNVQVKVVTNAKARFQEQRGAQDAQ